MKPVIDHCWHPVTGAPGQWHHFIITNLRVGVHDVIRVAYRKCDVDGKLITTTPDAETDHTARWHLPPAAASVWVAQRAHGYNGTVDSLSATAYFNGRR